MDANILADMTLKTEPLIRIFSKLTNFLFSIIFKTVEKTFFTQNKIFDIFRMKI